MSLADEAPHRFGYTQAALAMVGKRHTLSLSDMAMTGLEGTFRK